MLDKNHIIIVRSSVYPGICDQIFKILANKNIAYCPERIVQGKSFKRTSKTSPNNLWIHRFKYLSF